VHAPTPRTQADTTGRGANARDMADRQANSETGKTYLTLHELARAAREKLSIENWDYLVGGTETETTLLRNRQALDAIALQPRVLRDVSHIDTSGRLFGRPMRLPVLLAPVGGIASFDPGGAATAAQAAAEFGVPIMVSSVSKPGLEPTAAAAATGRKLFQLYVRGDEAWTDDKVRRAKAAGYEAFCFTVDSAIYSRRERDLDRRVIKRTLADVEEELFQAGLTWDHIKRYKDCHDLPLILKGIATPEDADLACRHGVAAVYVSNHGGRQLDHGLGAIDVLPDIVAAVAGRAEVIVDSGFIRGTDIIKALALGADAVGIGRAYVYGLAAAGRVGVVRVLELLEAEIWTSLGLLGVTRFAELDKSYLRKATPALMPGLTSALPLLDLDRKA